MATGIAACNGDAAAIKQHVISFVTKTGVVSQNHIKGRSDAVLQIWQNWNHDMTIPNAFNNLFILFLGTDIPYTTILALCRVAEAFPAAHQFPIIWNEFAKHLYKMSNDSGKRVERLVLREADILEVQRNKLTPAFWQTAQPVRIEAIRGRQPQRSRDSRTTAYARGQALLPTPTTSSASTPGPEWIEVERRSPDSFDRVEELETELEAQREQIEALEDSNRRKDAEIRALEESNRNGRPTQSVEVIELDCDSAGDEVGPRSKTDKTSLEQQVQKLTEDNQELKSRIDKLESMLAKVVEQQAVEKS